MKIVMCILTICLSVVLQPYTVEAQSKLDITLQGKGTVVEKQGMELMHVEGRVKGDITGAFLWEEEHQPAPDPKEALEKGTVTITDQNGHRLVLSFSGIANMTESGKSALEGAEGSFTYIEGTGHWAENKVEGTYTKAGIFRGGSIELTISLMAEVK